MTSGNWMVDAHDADMRREARRHLCECGCDGYYTELRCSELDTDCLDDCEFYQGRRSLFVRLLYWLGILRHKPRPKCEFCRVAYYCLRCDQVVEP